MIQIVVPMAGRGSRFANAGYVDPKPLIPVGGKPMIQWVIDNVRPAQPHQFTFICLSEHLVRYPQVPDTLRRLCPGCNIVTVDQVTEGAACTVLLAKEIINNDDPLMIANADQLVELDVNAYLAEMDKQQADGLIMTFEADHPKWSYCRMNEQGGVTEVVEKQVVSNEATVGIYNFRKGSDFVRAAEQMIARDLRVNGEFYVAPAYNQLIEEGSKVVVSRTGFEYNGMYGLGTPDDLDFFKTTRVYDAGRVDVESESVSKELLIRLTETYVKFFDSKNIAGVTAMLADHAVLSDPAVQNLTGQTAIVDYVKSLFDQHAELQFQANRIWVDGQTSCIEFELGLGNLKLTGVDVIEWSGRKIREIRAYLYEVK